MTWCRRTSKYSKVSSPSWSSTAQTPSSLSSLTRATSWPGSRGSSAVCLNTESYHQGRCWTLHGSVICWPTVSTLLLTVFMGQSVNSLPAAGCCIHVCSLQIGYDTMSQSELAGEGCRSQCCCSIVVPRNY